MAEAETLDAEHDGAAPVQLARANDMLPRQIHLLPVASRPFFPGQAVPLMMGAEHWAPTLHAVGETDHKILGVVLVQSESAEEATAADFSRIGTACRVHRVHRQDEHLQVLVECLQRFSIEG